MKSFLILILAVALVAGCSRQTAHDSAVAIDEAQSPKTKLADYPTLLIDEAHQIQGSNAPLAYAVTPTSGVRLDTSGFQFAYGTNPLTPNTVQVIVPHKAAYMLSTTIETNLYVIDRNTLKTVSGDSFPGFVANSTALIMIGRVMPNTDGKVSVMACWVGKVEAK